MYRTLLPLLYAASLSACGTISRGTGDEVAIDVEPRNATVRTSLGPACVGPCKVRAPRSADFSVTASARGYETQTVEVKRRVSLAGAGSVARNALGGPTVVGVGVDLYTGAAYDHVPNPVVIRLRPEEETSGFVGPRRRPPDEVSRPPLSAQPATTPAS
ncbi:translation initiation factor 2 [Aureimonas mangrovi]|uniref:translation initiation factor 2 n=1 Tax=Aureimonas mangrovi TaxID=2758041 RepID=UPI00163D77DA|nr:translation initiation factor 2 [Aureimonas mangrovi]